MSNFHFKLKACDFKLLFHFGGYTETYIRSVWLKGWIHWVEQVRLGSHQKFSEQLAVPQRLFSCRVFLLLTILFQFTGLTNESVTWFHKVVTKRIVNSPQVHEKGFILGYVTLVQIILWSFPCMYNTIWLSSTEGRLVQIC